MADVNAKVNVQSNIEEIRKELERIISTFAELSNKPANIKAKGIDKLKEDAEKLRSSINETRDEMNRLGAFDRLEFGFDDGSEELNDLSEQLSAVTNSLNSSNPSVEKFTENLLHMGINGNISLSSIQSMSASLGPYGMALSGVITILKSYNKIIEEFIEDSKMAGTIALDTFVGGLEGIGDACEYAFNLLSELNDKMQEFIDYGVDFQNGYFRMYNYLGSEAGEQVVDFTNRMEQLYNLDASTFVSDMKGVFGIVRGIGASADEMADYANALGMFINDVSAFGGESISSISSQLEQAINRGSLSKKGALAKSLLLSDADIEQFNRLNTIQERMNFLLSKGTGIRGTYNKFLETEAGKVYQLNQQYSSLMGNIGQLVLGLYAKVAPVLTMLLKLANSVVSSLAKLFNIDLTSSSSNFADSTQSISGGLNDVADSAKKATNKLAAFDDVIQINKDDSTGEYGDFSNFDISGLLGDIEDGNRELSYFEKKIKDIQKLLEEGKFKEAGKELAGLFNDWLTGIDWERINSNMINFGSNFASFINGFLTNSKLFLNIGKTLAKGINALGLFLKSFFETLNWKRLGKQLLNSWKGFWTNLDTELLADVVYEAISGVFKTGSTFIDGMFEKMFLNTSDGEMYNGFEIVGVKIADFINRLFSSLTDEDLDNIANTIIGLIDGVFQIVGTLLENLDMETIKEKIIGLFDRIGKSLNENAEEWGEIANAVIMGLLDAIRFVLDELDTSGIIDGINKFTEGLNLDEILKEWLYTKFELALTKLELLLPTLTDLLLGMFETNLEIFSGNSETSIYDKITKMLGDVIQRLFDYAKEKVKTFLSDIGDIFSDDTSIVEKLTKLIERIKGPFNSLNYMLNPMGAISTNVITSGTNWVSNKFKSIPKLASGGIAKQATFAMIGEDGKEAVLPLENNTGWMDVLASKISGMNNRGLSGGTINLDLSRLNKKVYTRSEMLEFGKLVVDSLKLYGVNVSVAY